MTCSDSIVVVLLVIGIAFATGHPTETSSSPAACSYNGCGLTRKECPYNCSICEEPWYTEGANKTCIRSEVRSTFYTFDFIHDSTDRIRDEASCMRLETDSGVLPTSFGSFHGIFNGSTGCRVEVQGSRFFNLASVQFRVCFGAPKRSLSVCSILVGILLGVALGLASKKCDKRRPSSGFVEHMDNLSSKWRVFGPGAKMVAKNSLVLPSRLMYVTFYRSVEVIVNVWLPMTLLWTFGTILVIPLWFLLYWLPAFHFAGWELLSNPIHLVTLRSCSLLGISPDQDAAAWMFLFSWFRPTLMVGATYGLGEIAMRFGRARKWDDSDIGSYVFNVQGYLNLGLNNHDGHLVFCFASWVTCLGVIFYMAMTLAPVYKSMIDIATRAPGHNKATAYDGELITLEEDKELYDAVQELAERICVAAAADDEDDEDRVGDLWVSESNQKQVAMQSWFCTAWCVTLAVLDFCAYLYKIFTFLAASKYWLAGLMTMACTEAITTLVVHGHLQVAAKAFERTAKTGVPSTHFLALMQWDDGVAGIPSLMLSVYGLPLIRPTQLQAISSIFFLITGTRALAVYCGDVADAGMFEVPQDVKYGGMSEEVDDEYEVDSEG